jgi:hypothetical protein
MQSATPGTELLSTCFSVLSMLLDVSLALPVSDRLLLLTEEALFSSVIEEPAELTW